MKRTVMTLLALLSVSTALAQQVTGLAGWNIVLDPGHSFRENMGVAGYSEAEKNVRVAWALRDLLLQTTDIDTVFLTREDDNTNVGLSSRSAYASSLTPPVSLHPQRCHRPGGALGDQLGPASLGSLADITNAPPAARLCRIS